MVSILITDTFIGEKVKPEKKHHQAYTPMGEKEEFCIIHNIIGDPLENMPVLPTPSLLTLFPASDTRKNDMRNYTSIPTVSCGQKRRSWRITW
jgi:hypothetical protein